MLRESLKLAEAVAIAVFLLPLFWIIRIAAIMYLTDVNPGLTLSGVPARWLGLAGVLAFCAMSTAVPRAHGRVTFALGLTFAGETLLPEFLGVHFLSISFRWSQIGEHIEH